MAEGAKVITTSGAPSTPARERAQYTRPEVRVRPNKAATDAGLTPVQRKAVNETEQRIRQRQTETTRAITPNGDVINPTIGNGTRNQARLNLRLVPSNSVITHNHPSFEGRGGTGLGADVGASFSANDLRTAANANAAEIRAVTPNYTFSVRRGANGWGASPDTLKREMDAAYQKYKREHLSVVNRYASGTRARAEAVGRLNGLASHQAIRDVAKKYGLIYTRRRAQ